MWPADLCRRINSVCSRDSGVLTLVCSCCYAKCYVNVAGDPVFTGEVDVSAPGDGTCVSQTLDRLRVLFCECSGACVSPSAAHVTGSLAVAAKPGTKVSPNSQLPGE